jgi:hypothetical protein
MQVRVDFTAANQSVVIDLTIEQQQKQISQVQGLWINNNTPANLELLAEVTNQLVNIPAGAQGYIQLLSQNPPRFRVTSDAIAKVDFHFLNFPVIHAMNLLDGTGDGVQSIVAGANITVDATDPQNPVISATGGGGGGGGKTQFSQIIKAGVGETITGTEVDAATFTPFFAVLDATVNLDLTTLSDNAFLVMFQSYSPTGTTIKTADGGGWIVDNSGSGVSSITCAQFEMIQFMFLGNGAGGQNALVLNRY